MIPIVATLAAVAALAIIWNTKDVARADAPAGRYTINGSGATATVLDTKTGLTWQQVPGSAMTYSAGLSYCSGNTPGLPGSGWRLPSVKELETIVDGSRVNPAIDPTGFPSTPTAAFWASSLDATNSANAWGVNFSGGDAYPSYTGTMNLNVRCVK